MLLTARTMRLDWANSQRLAVSRGDLGLRGNHIGVVLLEESKPVPVDGYGRIVPSVLESFGDESFWENVDEVFLAVGFSVPAKFIQGFRSVSVEIAEWHRRECFAFTCEEPANVATIFLQQCAGKIFGVSLEVYEQTFFSLLYKEVDAGVDGLV